MINLIPMAGLGTRFSQQGYTLSKPLIPISGIPMILKVIRDLPKAEKWVFVVRQEHLEFHVDDLIKKELPNAVFLIDKEPKGQAMSCMVAEKELDRNQELFVAACDNGFLYNEKKFEQLRKRKDVDCMIWTFTQRETLKRNPTAWGWYKLEDDKEAIKDISVKVPVSNDPYNDHAVVATFYFKKAGDFIDATNLMIKENYRINNEFYVDAIPRFLQKLGKKSVIFDVDLYVGWGKPDDLHDYEKIEFMVKNKVKLPNMTEEEQRLLPVWERYFAKK